MKGIKNMEINKQLFEDVLSGKLKGTFKLKNGFTVRSNRLFDSNRYSYIYALKGFSTSFTALGESSSAGYDIIDFIPDIDMKENELKIQIPEGYCIDESKSTFEKIVFKKKDIKPRSWEEYCNNFSGELFYFGNRNSIESVIVSDGMSYMAKDYLPSKELAEAFLAMMQLMSLRQAWIGNWKPEKDATTLKKWNVVYSYSEKLFCLFPSYVISYALSFPTQEMAEDFMNCFKDLLEVAKPLI